MEMREAITRLWGRENRRVGLYIPKELYRDSAFPFRVGDELRLRIEDGKLVIEKAWS